MGKVKYRDGYRYILAEDYIHEYTGILGYDIKTDFIELDINGRLLIKKYYASDGPSGPTIDTKSFMRGAFVHDALYQLMVEGLIPWSYRDQIDRLLISICKKDGMCWVRRQWVHAGVKYGYPLVKNSMSKKNRIQTAP
jgi:hypothetical protein